MTDESETPPVAEQTAAVRAVMRRALRDMLVLITALAVLGVVLGYLRAGVPGVWGAVVGVAVAVVFSGATVVSMLMTAGANAAVTGAVVLGGWIVKAVVFIGVFAVLRGMDFYDSAVLAVVASTGVLGSAFLDYRAVATGRVPYSAPPS
jgi:hypothetical protein